MKNLLSLLLLFTSFITIAKPTFIPSDKLFTKANNYDGQLSPKGKYFSYLTNEESYQYLVFVDLDSHEILSALSVSEDMPITDYFWISPSTLSVTLNQKGEYVDHLVEVKRLNRNGETYIESTYTELDKGYIVDVLINEPEHVLFAKVEMDGDDREQSLYHISLAQLKSADFDNTKMLEEELSDVLAFSLDIRFNRILGVFLNNDESKISIKYRGLNSKKWHELLTFDGTKNISPIGFLDDTTLAVLTNENSDKVGLYSFDTKTGDIKEALYVHEQYDLTDALISNDGRVVFVKYIENGKPHTEWIDSYSKHLTARFKKTFSGDVPLITQSNLAGDRLLILVHGPNNSGKYYIYKEESDELMFLFELYSGLDQYNVPEHSTIKVKAEDGTQIEAYLSKPQGVDHKTLLVMPHGGPIGVRDYNLFTPDVQYLVNRGFTILRVNFRGSEGFGKKFKEQGVGEFGKKIEEDISLVVHNLLSKESYEHVCAIGSSYGAYSSLMLSLKKPELYECVIASYGVYDLPLLFNYSNLKSGEEYTKYIAKVVGENTADKKSDSPVYQAKNVSVPLLLIAGKKDTVAGFEQSNRMRYVLEMFNKDVESIFYERAGHGHSSWYGKQHQYAYMVEFLIKVLNLSPIKLGALSEGDREAIAHDYTVLADGFNNKYLTIKKGLSFKYTKLASKFGSERLTFNLASHYHRGDVVEKDISEAIKYYQLAAEQGHKNSYPRLGNIYLARKHLEQSDEKAHEYITKALKNDATDNNLQLMARFYCSAGEKYKSVEKCISLFEIQARKFKVLRKKGPDEWLGEQVSSLRNKGDEDLKKKRSTLFDDMSKVLIDNTFTQEDQLSYQKLMSDVMDLSHPDFTFVLESASLTKHVASEQYGRSGEYIEIEMSELAQLEKEINNNNIWLRIKFTPDHEGLPSWRRTTFALLYWQEISPDGEKVRSNWKRINHNAKDEWHSYFNIKEYSPGHSYKVKIYDAAGRVKFEEEFKAP